MLIPEKNKEIFVKILRFCIINCQVSMFVCLSLVNFKFDFIFVFFGILGAAYYKRSKISPSIA